MPGCAVSSPLLQATVVDPIIGIARFRQIPNIRAEDLARIIKLNHLDDPWYTGYWRWLKGFVTGDWGTSATNPANTAIGSYMGSTRRLS